MNDNEITLKINCSVDEFKKILENKGFKFYNKFLLDDTFFIPNTLDIKTTSIRSILNNAIFKKAIRIIKLTY